VSAGYGPFVMSGGISATNCVQKNYHKQKTTKIKETTAVKYAK